MLARFTMTRKLLFTLFPLIFVIFLGTLLFIHNAVDKAVTKKAVEAAQELALAEGERVLDNLVKDLSGLEALSIVLKTKDQFSAQDRRTIVNTILKGYLTERAGLLEIGRAHV